MPILTDWGFDMGYYPDVHPGDDVDNSAERENDVRHLLNKTSGFRDGVNRARLHSVRIPVWNLTPYTINEGTLVYVVVTSDMCGDAFPVAPLNYNPYDPQFLFDDAPFGVLETSLKAKDTGSLVLSGTVKVSITAGTAGNFAKPVPTGGFERGREGFRILHLNGTGTDAIILVGDYRMPDYQAGNGINHTLLSGGTISTNLVQGTDISITPVVGSTNGELSISYTGSGGGGGGGDFDVPAYNQLYVSGNLLFEKGGATTFVVRVKAGNVGFWDEGHGAVGVYVDKTGTTRQELTNKQAYNAASDGYLRISVYDDGTYGGECLSFFSPTGGLPLYKYRSNYYQYIGCDISGGTAFVGVSNSTSVVKFKGEGSVEIDGIRRHATSEEISAWGRRYNPATGEMDGDWKNAGWRGIIPLENGDVMTEYSESSEIGGVEVCYPLIVPNTTNDELETIKYAISYGDRFITQSIRDKAVSWAESRIAHGKSPFYNGDAEDEQYRVIDNLIIVRGKGIESTVTGGTAFISTVNGTNSARIVGVNITITENSNGEIVLTGSTSGGGGGSGFIPAWSNTGHTDVIPITDGSGQGYTANADGWLFACAFFDPIEDRLKYKQYDAHVIVGNAAMKIAELKLPGGTPFIKVGNVKYTRDLDEDWSSNPYAEHPYYSYFAWSANGTTIYTSNVAPLVGESTYTYDSEEEDFVDNESEVQETNAATFAVCIGSGSPIPVKSGAVIKFVVTADGYTFYSRRTPPPCFCVFYSSNPPATP